MGKPKLFALLMLFCISMIHSGMQACAWEAEVLPVELSVGYAVRAIDVSGDGILDIAIVDSKRILWLENPTWKVHVIYETPDAKFDNVCFAPHDIDGDGDVDLAIGHDWQFTNSNSGGIVGWLRSPSNPRQPWAYAQITQEPTTHRMQWIDWDGDQQQELLVVPLKGRGATEPKFDEAGVRMMRCIPKLRDRQVQWDVNLLTDQLHVCHNIDVVDFDQDGQQDILAASFEGVSLLTRDDSGNVQQIQLGSGQTGAAPAIGSSEIRLGYLAENKPYIATIEPWHGDKVVVYTPAASDRLWTRHEIDTQLKWGHAVHCANLDNDPEQELIIGVRDNAEPGHRAGVRVYDPVDAAQGEWQRTLIEPGQVAVEDLVVADFDQDGDIDIVAVGRATHNAVVYWNE